MSAAPHRSDGGIRRDAITVSDASGTAPHVEVNYGVWPDVQLHVIAPLAYARRSGDGTSYGPVDIELGAKLRFVQARSGRWAIATTCARPRASTTTSRRS